MDNSIVNSMRTQFCIYSKEKLVRGKNPKNRLGPKQFAKLCIDFNILSQDDLLG